jgi:hypothetical protein
MGLFEDRFPGLLGPPLHAESSAPLRQVTKTALLRIAVGIVVVMVLLAVVLFLPRLLADGGLAGGRPGG